MGNENPLSLEYMLAGLEACTDVKERGEFLKTLHQAMRRADHLSDTAFLVAQKEKEAGNEETTPSVLRIYGAYAFYLVNGKRMHFPRSLSKTALATTLDEIQTFALEQIDTPHSATTHFAAFDCLREVLLADRKRCNVTLCHKTLGYA